VGIRQLAHEDLPRITEIADRGLEFDVVNEPLIREKTVGAKDYVAELGLVYENEGGIVGFVQGADGRVIDGKQVAYIRIFVMDRSARGQGIGSALLTELEVRLKKRGAQMISTMDCPANYFMPGVDFRYTEAYCFFLKQGYAFFRENHNLIAPLEVAAWPGLDAQIAELRSDGIEVRRAHKTDETPIHEFLQLHWAGWRNEVQGALDNDPCTVHIAIQNGGVIAFSGYQGNNKSLPWFGPMGTQPGLRGKGIGGLLLRLCLRDLARQGYDHAIIPWVGPVRFYARYSDARLDRCFWVYRKEL
jgi:mycothiol synthase